MILMKKDEVDGSFCSFGRKIQKNDGLLSSINLNFDKSQQIISRISTKFAELFLGFRQIFAIYFLDFDKNCIFVAQNQYCTE